MTESARLSYGTRRWTAMSAGKSAGQARTDIETIGSRQSRRQFVEGRRRRPHHRRAHFRNQRRERVVVERRAGAVHEVRSALVMDRRGRQAGLDQFDPAPVDDHMVSRGRDRDRPAVVMRDARDAYDDSARAPPFAAQSTESSRQAVLELSEVPGSFPGVSAIPGDRNSVPGSLSAIGSDLLRCRGMTRHESGPRRSQSIDSILRTTRLLAVVALLALAGGIALDFTEEKFWGRHALLAGLVSSVIVVMLSLAVVNEVLDRRRRERWSILAQFVMLELVRNARVIWLGLLSEIGLLAPGAMRPGSIDANRAVVRDSSRVVAAVRKVLADDAGRHRLQDEIAILTDHTDEVISRWAAIMLNTDAYAEVIDRHVELAGDMGWLSGLLDSTDPPADHRRRRRAASSPAVQVEGDVTDEDLANRIVVIAQLAERLDRTTLEFALRLVPLAWWQTRLGAPPAADADKG